MMLKARVLALFILTIFLLGGGVVLFKGPFSDHIYENDRLMALPMIIIGLVLSIYFLSSAMLELKEERLARVQEKGWLPNRMLTQPVRRR